MNYLFYDDKLGYPDANNNFSPSVKYPEYPFDNCIANSPNNVYDAIRTMFYDMGLDQDNYGTNKWNPLGKWIKPGMNVCLKPNFVMHKNGSENPDDLDSLVTHPSIIRCLLDYCYIALRGKGTLVVGDAPVKDCDFDKLMNSRKYIDIVSFYKSNTNMDLEFYDFRGPEEEGGQYKTFGRGVRVNLGDKSWFYDYNHNNSKLRIPNYDYKKVMSHHCGNVQEYLINSTVLDADVVISIPKPKTHRKNGYTAALKNFVGINYSKEYLPHHTEGSVFNGGDEYIINSYLPWINSKLRLIIDKNRINIDKASRHNLIGIRNILAKSQSIMWHIYSKIMKNDIQSSKKKYSDQAYHTREGSWYGNDTLWRTVLDLNYVLKYAKRDGSLSPHAQRVVLNVGDMIVSGEKEGPMAPSYKKQHMLLFSDNVVDFDCIATKIMGFDYLKFTGLRNAVYFKPLSDHQYDNIVIKSNYDECNGYLKDIDFSSVSTPFIPSEGWIGHVEMFNS